MGMRRVCGVDRGGSCYRVFKDDKWNNGHLASVPVSPEFQRHYGSIFKIFFTETDPVNWSAHLRLVAKIKGDLS